MMKELSQPAFRATNSSKHQRRPRAVVWSRPRTPGMLMNELRGGVMRSQEWRIEAQNSVTLSSLDQYCIISDSHCTLSTRLGTEEHYVCSKGAGDGPGIVIDEEGEHIPLPIYPYCWLSEPRLLGILRRYGRRCIGTAFGE
jgi:hypothetical protein